MQCEICGGFFNPTGGDTYDSKFICDNCQLIVKNIADELALGDLVTKAHSELTGITANQHHNEAHTLDSHSEKKLDTLDEKTPDAGVTVDGCLIKDNKVADSNLLETSTKAQVQDHTPKSHTHTESDVTDLDHDDTDAFHDNVASEISAIAEKGTPIDADLLLIEDSAASNAKKKVQIGNLPSGGGGATFVVSGAQAYSGNSPTSWTDLDLSSIVGSNSAMVILAFRGNIDINALAVRKNGDTNEYYNASAEANAYGCALGHHDSVADLVLICVTDTNGIIEWKAESAVVCTVDVIAYIK